MILDDNFTYIDLFAGIGGFHCAMDKFSNGKAKCVLASEIDEKAKKIYEHNFKMIAHGDIKQIKKSDINTKIDVVCAGFPCQTFSKAGMQKGFGDPRGTLFKEIVRLIESEKVDEQPKILILENVRNLISHDNGITWRTIRSELERVNYNVIKTPIVLGPKDFNIPQLRDRAIILAVRKDIYNGEICIDFEKRPTNSTSIFTIVDSNLSKKEKQECLISNEEKRILDIWNKFVKGLNLSLVGFPIWSDEFGDERDIKDLPLWKQDFINKNRTLYKNNKTFIDRWLIDNHVRDLSPTYRKFEWQVGNKIHDIYDGIIQFRPSGIRVKLPTESPALVAMVHVPIIGKYKRRLTVNEAKRLQSFPTEFDFGDERSHDAYKQLGNAVNVEVIYQAFSSFVNYLNKTLT